MKLGALFGWFVPELRRLNGNQLLKVWGGCTSYSRNAIYVHCILLLACCSAIFNLSLKFSDSIFLHMIALLFGLTVPPNFYFAAILGGRREQIRRFVEEHWNEFNP